MNGYTLTRPNGVTQAFRDHASALAAFKSSIRVDGLPAGDGKLLIHLKTKTGRILRLAADSGGIWDLDGSGVPADCAVGDDMAASWARQ